MPLFGPSKSEQVLRNEVPMCGTPMPPTDPLIYRFYELIMIDGPALKVLIEEEFGDGIMSAIDLDMEVGRVSHSKGDRVKLGMTGKFLPYKYYSATSNDLALVIIRQRFRAKRRPMVNSGGRSSSHRNLGGYSMPRFCGA